MNPISYIKTGALLGSLIGMGSGGSTYFTCLMTEANQNRQNDPSTVWKAIQPISFATFFGATTGAIDACLEKPRIMNNIVKTIAAHPMKISILAASGDLLSLIAADKHVAYERKLQQECELKLKKIKNDKLLDRESGE